MKTTANKTEKKAKAKKPKKAKGILAKYNEKKTKKNLGNTGLKTLVDLVAGTTLGAGIGSGLGRLSLPIGLLMIASGHYLEEESGILRIAGSATIAYGIGKAITHKNIAKTTAVSGISLAGETSKAKIRLAQFKDELFTAFYLDKVFKSKGSPSENQEVGAVDLSELDVFEQDNYNQAYQYQEELPDSSYSDTDYSDYPDYMEEEDLVNFSTI
jgi:hypothetical protein